MISVYLASWFSSLEEMRERAEQLRVRGVPVTSRWLEERVSPTTQLKDVSHEYLQETARIDIHDILLANVVVLNTPSLEDLKSLNIPTSSWARGGRHFESGFHYALMMFFKYLPKCIQDIGPRKLILVGGKENVFHHLDNTEANGLAYGFELPEILEFDTWENAKNFIVRLSGQNS